MGVAAGGGFGREAHGGRGRHTERDTAEDGGDPATRQQLSEGITTYTFSLLPASPRSF